SPPTDATSSVASRYSLLNRPLRAFWIFRLFSSPLATFRAIVDLLQGSCSRLTHPFPARRRIVSEAPIVILQARFFRRPVFPLPELKRAAPRKIPGGFARGASAPFECSPARCASGSTYSLVTV